MSEPRDSDLPYTAAIITATTFGLVVELLALRHRPGKRATWSAHVWWLLGQRYSWRWCAGAAGWTWLTAHWFFRRTPCQ